MSRIPSLIIAPEKVFFVIDKARQSEVADIFADPDGADRDEPAAGSAAIDPIRVELRNYIREMNEDEQIDLVALAWLGRSDSDLDAFVDLRDEAAAAHNRRTASYLLGMPLLAAYLEDAMAAFGYSEEDFEPGSN